MIKTKSNNDIIIDSFLYLSLVILALLTLYPFLNSLAISLNDANDSARGGISLLPRKFTIENYKIIFSDDMLFQGFFISILRTVIGTFASILATGMFAYGMSKSYLFGRKVYMTLCVVTMYFSGGLIPFYLLIRSLHLTNNFWVYVIPNLISIWNMIIMITYFKGLPDAIEESARIDGARQFTIFFRLIVPLSAPIIATIALFNGVYHWNSWFDAYIFITNQNLKPVQSILIGIINSNRFEEAMLKAGAAAQDLGRRNKVSVRSITMAIMIATVIPIVMVYPFLQKYFIKGILIGSVKG